MAQVFGFECLSESRVSEIARVEFVKFGRFVVDRRFHQAVRSCPFGVSYKGNKQNVVTLLVPQNAILLAPQRTHMLRIICLRPESASAEGSHFSMLQALTEAPLSSGWDQNISR